jgi:hypothetical protein
MIEEEAVPLAVLAVQLLLQGRRRQLNEYVDSSLPAVQEARRECVLLEDFLEDLKCASGVGPYIKVPRKRRV